MNYEAGQTLANFVVVQPDRNGNVCFYSSAGADLLWDQVSEPNTAVTQDAARLIDTRFSGPIAPR